MSSKRLAQIVDTAYRNDDVELARTAFNQYQVGQCYYPTWQTIFDAHSQTYRKVLLPCGRCYHCYETKINEWCTRMYAHAEDFKHVYFVTLTYRSFYNIENSVNKLLLNKLEEAIWHLDSFNSTHRMGYNPCLLVKKHYQNFIKRLRKNTGLSDLTYVLSGEYGSDYGRPHFHIILFTNGTLTREDVVRAWSVCLWRSNDGSFSYRRNQRYNGNSFDFPIGRVDFHDLVSNGTFNTTMKIKVDGTYMNAANCFAYVCKYVCKRNTGNLNRVRIAYNSLYRKQIFVKVFNNEIAFNIVRDYLLQIGYRFDQIDDIFNSLKKLQYEKSIFSPQGIYNNALCPQKSGTLFGFPASFDVYPPVFYEFRDLYRPFCEFSRSTPIGSVYAKRNIQEFAQGVFTKPLLQSCAFVVPSYFRRKAKDYLYGLRICRKTIRSSSDCLGGLLDLYGRFALSDKTGIPPREYFLSASHHESYETALFNPNRVFKDAYTGERTILADGFARSYKYNRSERKFVNTINIPVSEWIKNCLQDLKDEFSRYNADQVRISENMRLRDRSFCLLTDMGLFPEQLRDSFIDNSEQVRRSMQQDYNAIHISVE